MEKHKVTEIVNFDANFQRVPFGVKRANAIACTEEHNALCLLKPSWYSTFCARYRLLFFPRCATSSFKTRNDFVISKIPSFFIFGLDGTFHRIAILPLKILLYICTYEYIFVFIYLLIYSFVLHLCFIYFCKI